MIFYCEILFHQNHSRQMQPPAVVRRAGQTGSELDKLLNKIIFFVLAYPPTFSL